MTSRTEIERLAKDVGQSVDWNDCGYVSLETPIATLQRLRDGAARLYIHQDTALCNLLALKYPEIASAIKPRRFA